MLTEYERQRRKWLRIRKSNILEWLFDHDYIINKVFLSEWERNDPRYIEYNAQRKAKREELDEIEEELMELECKPKSWIE